MNNLVRAEINVSGYVQGVGYRYFASKHANLLGLTGVIKNLWDGDVNIVVEGKRDNIEIFQRNLKQGPTRSMVSKVDIKYSEFLGNFKSFQIE